MSKDPKSPDKSKKPSKADIKRQKEDEKKRKKDEKALQKGTSSKKIVDKAAAAPSTEAPPLTPSSSTTDLKKPAPVAEPAPAPAVTPSASTSSQAASSSAASSSNAPIIESNGDWTIHNALQPSLKQFADVTFNLAGGDQLFAHSYILDVRCPKLADQIPKKKLKKGDKKKWTPCSLDFTSFHISKLTVIDRESLQQGLTFIYSDTKVLNLEEIEPMKVLKLAMFARTFELARLLKLCEDRLESCLNMDNVYMLLKVAHDNDEKRIGAFCMDFAHQNIKAFIHAKDRLKDLGMELVQEVVEMSLEEYVPKPKDVTPVPDSILIADFQRLYAGTASQETFADGFVTLKASRIPFHKAILAAHAKSFAGILPPSGNNDDATEFFQLRAAAKAKADDKLQIFNLEPDTFRAMLKYIYYSDASIEPLTACNLAAFLPRFQLTGLQLTCQNTISNNVKPDTVLDILRVAYLPEYADREDIRELRASSLSFVAANPKTVNLDPLIQMDQAIAVDLLKTIQTLAK